MDIIKNCLDNFVAKQQEQASTYEEGYKAGYAEGLIKAREEYEKNLAEATQTMLEGMFRDYEAEKKDRS